MTLEKMYELDKEATRRLFDIIKDIANVELLENGEGIRFTCYRHTFIFTAELED